MICLKFDSEATERCGSLTPELEGASRSAAHPLRSPGSITTLQMKKADTTDE